MLAYAKFILYFMRLPMQNHPLRCLLSATIASLVLSQTTFSQPVENESEFDPLFEEPIPVLQDNLPPDGNLQALEDTPPPPPIATSILQVEMQPFNSRRADLVDVLESPLRSVTINGQIVALRNPERVTNFYLTEIYPTVWTHEDAFLPALESLQAAIEAATDDALPPARYHQALLAGLSAGQTHHDIVAYELLLSDAYLTLAGDLANGLVDPRRTHPTWNAQTVSDIELGEMLARGIRDNNLRGELDAINANNSRYQHLKALYNSQRGNGQTTPAGQKLPAVNLKPGMDHPAVLILREKIGVSGDSTLFDAELAQAVKEYQRGIGVPADGIIGPGMRKQLNGNSVASANNVSLDSLKINMERQRWMPQDEGASYILANIPSYRVQMFRDGSTIYDTKAIVGRKDRPTPAFTDRMRHVVMSPTWTVPPTILKKDKLPQLRNNPGAFNGNYEVVTPGGRVVKPSDVNWGAVNPANYALRQKPGGRNALGRVKFLFPNKHAIYLHDTPQKSLFNRSSRALSSGCIRLHDPMEFAEILLQGTEWTPEKIKSASHQSKERWVNPPEETPIYLVYWTTWTDLQGKILSAPDIYNLDKTLLTQYNSAF